MSDNPGSQMSSIPSTDSGNDEARAESSESVNIEAILDRLTLAEKVGQITQIEAKSFDTDEVGSLFHDLGIGSCLFGGGRPPSYDPVEVATGVNELQSYNLEHTSHGIPVVFGIDSLHGNATVNDATVFPHNIGIGATRNPDIVTRMGDVTGKSVESIGAHWGFSPTTDVLRDQRWGRYYEGFSEDPYLTGDLASAEIAGLQGDGSETRTAACMKHFAGYSIPENGNDRSAANISLRDLRTTILPAYARALENDPETVMISSGSINGIPAHGSRWLLTSVLRDRWGYDGLIVSDWRDFKRMKNFHDYVPTYREGIKRGLNAGVDMYMNPKDPEKFVSLVIELVESGEVPESRLDDAVRRVLQFKANLGLFEDPFVSEGRIGQSVSAGRDLAKTITSQSLTLLRNEDDALPLEDIDSLFLTGPGTDSVEMQMGGWTLGWDTVGDGNAVDAAPGATTLYDALIEATPQSTDVIHEPTAFEYDSMEYRDSFGFDNEAAVVDGTERADAVVAAVGEGPYAEWFGDRDQLTLHSVQRDLIRTLSETADDETPLIGVIYAGRPIGDPEILELFDAILMAYRPGTAGGSAVAETLLGENNPSGRLPFVWPVSSGQTPAYHNSVPEPREAPHVDDAVFERDPLYEFGHGLSYTDFTYSDLTIEPGTVSDVTQSEQVTVEIQVENDGDRSGEHIVEAYVENAYGSVMHPRRRLLCYDRVRLAPGEQTAVTMRASLEKLEVVPGDLLGLEEKVVEASEYTISVGDQTETLHIESSGSVSNRGPITPPHRTE